MSRIKKLSAAVSNNGVNALDLIGERVSGGQLAQAKQLVQMNYGVTYPKEKFEMLFEQIVEDGWTEKRFEAALKWFLKKKKFPNWTIADWYEYGCKLYPYSKYLEELNNNRSLNEQIEWYIVGDVKLWKYIDDVELPFEKFTPGGKTGDT